MAQELSTTDRLRHALAQWRDWETGLTGAPELLLKLDSQSNDAFLVAADQQRFVVRVNSPARSLGVDRRAELEILSDIAGRDYAPEVVFGGDEVLVTRYIRGGHPARGHHQSWLDEAGRLFRAIHATPTRVSRILDPLRQAGNYVDAIDRPEPILTACLEALRGRPPATPKALCLCHNDLLPKNILRSSRGWIAIDWEYAALGDPAFDIAVLMETLCADEADLDGLLAAYGSDEPRARIPYYQDLYRLIEFLWWRLRAPDTPISPGIDALAIRLGIEA